MGCYNNEWERYRRVRNTSILLWLGFLPAVWILHSFSGIANSEPIIGVLMAIYFLVWVAWGIRVSLFRCPRCGKCLNTTWWFSLGGLNRSCLHCGLKKFSSPPE